MRVFSRIPGIVLIGAGLIGPSPAASQAQHPSPADSAGIVAVAIGMMKDLRYCALITLDSTGAPNVRTMEPFPPDSDLTVWLGTNRNSRKVAEIAANPRVSLYYADSSGNGYVTITGVAELVDDPVEKRRRWKKTWDAFYPDRESMYLLIRVVPLRLEVVSYARNLVGEEKTWRPPTLRLNGQAGKQR